MEVNLKTFGIAIKVELIQNVALLGTARILKTYWSTARKQ